jgi:Domain of unknown function (DUF4412)
MKPIVRQTRTVAAPRAILTGAVIATTACLAACSHSSAEATPNATASATPSAAAAPSATSTPSVVDKALSFLSGGGFEGEITMAMTPENKPPTSSVFDIKGEKLRVSAPAMGNGERMYTIIDFGAKKMWLVSDTKKAAMTMNWDEIMGIATAAQKRQVGNPPVATGRKDVVAGYACEIYQTTDPNGEKGEACLAKGIHFPRGGITKGSWLDSLEDDLFPMRVDSKSPVDKGKLHMEVTKVDKKPMDDSLFVPPAGYKTESMEDAIKQLGGGKAPPGKGKHK